MIPSSSSSTEFQRRLTTMALFLRSSPRLQTHPGLQPSWLGSRSQACQSVRSIAPSHGSRLDPSNPKNRPFCIDPFSRKTSGSLTTFRARRSWVCLAETSMSGRLDTSWASCFLILAMATSTHWNCGVRVDRRLSKHNSDSPFDTDAIDKILLFPPHPGVF